MILIFCQYFTREFEITISQVTDILSQIGFFILVMMLFPLSLGPDPKKLSEYGIALVWIAAFVSVVPAYDRLFTDDYLHGFIEKAAHNAQPLGCYAAAKCLCFFLVTTLPLIIILPAICAMIGITSTIFWKDFVIFFFKAFKAFISNCITSFAIVLLSFFFILMGPNIRCKRC